MDLDRFRNLEHQKVELHPRFNLLLGPNGQGKTNFLEAVGYLGSLRSFRSAGRSDMIQRGQGMCRVSGTVFSGGVERAMAFALTRKGRSQFLDDRKVSSPEEFLQALTVVHFIPEDVGLVSGPPSWRRRVIDRSVFEISPVYVVEYRRYLSVLRHRNALLRKARFLPGEMESWNRSLASAGACLVHRRRGLMEALEPVMGGLGERLGLGPGLRLAYVTPSEEEGPRVEGARGPEDSVERDLLRRLEEGVSRETRAGHTLSGPHRDNILFTLGEGEAAFDLARFGSQGQKRSAVLAFKVALARVYFKVHGNWPLVILDDVASELDSERRKALGTIVREMEAQFFISTTGEEYMFLPAEEGRIWQVENGRLRPHPVSGGPQESRGAAGA